MKTAERKYIFYITEKGYALARRLLPHYPGAMIEEYDASTIPMHWENNDALIFIMATGIVVRTIAPLVGNKQTDPAVLVLDEKGMHVISLLSGHLGGANQLAKEIAQFLGGDAVITTASDINNLPALDLWAQEHDLVIENSMLLPTIGTRLLNSGALRVYTEIDIELPQEFLRSRRQYADILITNKKDLYAASDCQPGQPECCHPEQQLYLRPKNLVVGIGCNSGTSAEEIERTVKDTLDGHNLSFLSVHCIATIDKKKDEPGLLTFAKKYDFEIVSFSSDALNQVKGIEKSEAAFKATGAQAVAEPAAILASGADHLLISKQKVGNVTVAVAEERGSAEPNSAEARKCGSTEVIGKIFIVGTGPGGIDHITPYAQRVLRDSDAIVGYDTYLDLVRPLIADKEIVSTGMTQEKDRCEKAIELARSGKTVSIISGGDPGIYAMAGLVFEILSAEGTSAEARKLGSQGVTEEVFFPSALPHFRASALSVEVIPGISALNACAARLGAPLMHDFAVISLSDRLTPWELIEKRLEAAAEADFVIVLYNPKSKGRQEHIARAQEILLKHKKPDTPVGIVKGAMRADERVVITDLKDMLQHEIDMQTTVLIGNSQTFIWNDRMITPRGYRIE